MFFSFLLYIVENIHDIGKLSRSRAAMESHAQAVEDHLIDGLSFKFRPTASYVTDRRSVTFFPQGGDKYSSATGVKVIRITLNGDQWLDPSTVKLMFTFKNTTATPCLPITPNPSICFQRFRLLCGGQVIEDINNYNRTFEMFHMLSPGEKRLNDFVEGFGLLSARTEGNKVSYTSSWESYPIMAGQNRIVMFSPLSGLLNQESTSPSATAPSNSTSSW
jgi:hypothetical protein